MNEFEQLTIFDCGLYDKPEPLKIRKPIRLIELFAGIGSQAMSLRDIGANFEHYRAVEYDKYAIASYNAIHGTDFPTMDITKIHAEDLGIVKRTDFTYLLTYSFPCQDLSIAGRQGGMVKGSGTRSGLLWEVERLLNECGNDLPQILLMENVTQVHGSKNKDDFEKWLAFLEKKGYTNVWSDLNAKDYGIPQNRDRCFCVSFLGNYSFEFPKPIELTTCIIDNLEEEVPERLFIESQRAKDLIQKLIEDDKLPAF